MLRASNLRDVGTKGTMGVRGGADLGQGGPEPAGESNVVPLLQPSSPASHLGKALEVDGDGWGRAEQKEQNPFRTHSKSVPGSSSVSEQGCCFAFLQGEEASATPSGCRMTPL